MQLYSNIVFSQNRPDCPLPYPHQSYHNHEDHENYVNYYKSFSVVLFFHF